MRFNTLARVWLGAVVTSVFAVACSSFSSQTVGDSDDAGSASDATSEPPAVTGSPADTAPPKEMITSPKQLAGLTVWLDSSQGVTYDSSNAATLWTDESGNGNSARLIAPCYDMNTNVVPCVGPLKDPATLNGRDTLKGDGARYLSIADSPGVQFGTGDFAIFVVARYTVTAATAAPFWYKGAVSSGVGDTTARAFLFGQQMLTLEQSSASSNLVKSAATSLDDNAFRRLGGARRGGVLEVWVNGLANGKATLPTVEDVSDPGLPAHVGGPSGMVGNLAEVVVVKGTMSDDDVAALDAYFKQKWSLAN